MHTLQNTVLDLIHLANPLLSRPPPRQKHDSIGPLLCNKVNHLLRELLPPFVRMAVCFVSPHGQASIQQQYAAIRPGCEQAAVLRGRREGGVFFLEELVDVLQGRGCGRGWADGEAEAVGLVDVVVGVLAYDYHFDGWERSMAGPEVVISSIF